MTVHLNPHKPVPALPPEGIIGVIAPAGPGALDTDKAVQWMRARGYGLKVFPGVYEKDGYLAGSDDVRLRDLHAAFADPEVDAIICLRGGYGCAQLVADIDWALLRHAEGKLTAAEASAAKLWHTESQWQIVDAALQLHGGAGYMNEYAIARLWRDARVQRIYGGTSEIMKEIVGRSL